LGISAKRIDDILQSLSEIENILREAKILVEELNTVKSENKQLKTEIVELKNKLSVFEEKINELKNEKTRLSNTLKSREVEINRLNEKVSSLTSENKKLKEDLELAEKRFSEMDEHKRKLEEENKKLKGELNKISEQLEKISQMYKEIAGERKRVEDIKELLTIYVTLLETVFAGMPHAKVLWLLHGVPKMRRSEVMKTAGFEPAIILKSIYDLERAKLVEYDRDKEEIRLIRKLY